MKTLAIALSIGLAIALSNIDMPASNSVGTPDHQTVIVIGNMPSFERGSYSILSYDYDKSTILSDKELISILELAGFEDYGLRMAWAIVQKESTARPYAHNDNPKTGDDSYGLFQINMMGSMGPERMKKHNLSSKLDLFNPLTNAQIAYKMSSGGKNWNAWSAKDKAMSILSSFPG
jgi:hypothetical protein